MMRAYQPGKVAMPTGHKSLSRLFRMRPRLPKLWKPNFFRKRRPWWQKFMGAIGQNRGGELMRKEPAKGLFGAGGGSSMTRGSSSMNRGGIRRSASIHGGAGGRGAMARQQNMTHGR